MLLNIIFGKPFQCSLFLNKSNIQLLQSNIEKGNYDYLFFDMLRTGILAKYVKINKNTKIICHYDDLLSLRYERILKDKKKKNLIKLFGSYKIFHNKFLNINYFVNFILLIEKYRIRSLEKQGTKIFDKITFSSNNEKKIFQKKI